MDWPSFLFKPHNVILLSGGLYDIISLNNLNYIFVTWTDK